jgi:RimJ/RimL family protein N-acetyltransferase
MVTEITFDSIDAYASYFNGPHVELTLQSAIAGNTAARLWAIGQPRGRAILLLWDQGNNVLYLSGELSAESTQRAVAELIHGTIRPQAIGQARAYFKARALTPALETALAALFQGIALRELPTLLYGLTHAPPAPPVAGIRLLPIDRALLASTALANVEHIRAEIGWMWPSEERFYEQGFGWAAAVENQVVCWCTAEYLSADRCGVGITTVPEFERRGIATATAGQFLREALRRGQTPYWECRSDNIGSIRVAEKLGFVLLAEERYWAGMFQM